MTVTRLTADERRAIQLEIDDARRELEAIAREIARLQSMLDAQPAGSDGDTTRMLRPLCSCGLPLDHRHPITGEPRGCEYETERIALTEARGSRPPVPQSIQTTPGGWSFRSDESGREPSDGLRAFVDNVLRHGDESTAADR